MLYYNCPKEEYTMLKKWTVYLHKGDEEISYGDLTKIAPVKKTEEINGVRVKRAKEDIEKDTLILRERIIRELNARLPSACLRQKTMYYYAVEQ